MTAITLKHKQMKSKPSKYVLEVRAVDNFAISGLGAAMMAVAIANIVFESSRITDNR